MNDTLGDRMKMYEGAEAGRRFMPLLPIIARIDGRSFHSVTKGCMRPYDPLLSMAMLNTTVALVKETNACMGYTQSDEITLAWYSKDVESQIYFDGRIAKMTSQLAAHATLAFYKEALANLPDIAKKNPTFDARVWQVPNVIEGANTFLWREWDATKNSISMAAAAFYSHKELHGKSGPQKQEMLFQKGINWNDYPTFFKRGSYIQRKIVKGPFTADDLEKLPEKHAARTNPNLLIDRSVFRRLEMPVLGSVVNREAVIFSGAEPVVISS